MESLEYGRIYHIFSKGVNGCNLFYTNNNYRHFLRLYEKYIDPVAETYAWALLGNHFHFLVRIKEEHDINLNQLPRPVHCCEDYIPNLKKIHLYFSDLLNSYAQSINKQENRTGTLFERPFRRLHVDNHTYLRNLVLYIHNNPVRHGFTNDHKDYPWSSYGTIITLNKAAPFCERVIGWFNGKGEFINSHLRMDSSELISKYIIE
jgi:REP element-mobilizing transposase RayT